MAAMKKGTKLTDNPKNFMLRVRMDNDITKKLDAICIAENKSRSEIVRQGIEIQYHNLKK